MSKTNLLPNLKFLLESRGVSVTKLSNILSVSRNVIYNYLSGENEMGSDKLVAIAEFFKVSLDVLIYKDLEKTKDLKIDLPKLEKRRATVEDVLSQSQKDTYESLIDHLQAHINNLQIEVDRLKGNGTNGNGAKEANA